MSDFGDDVFWVVILVFRSEGYANFFVVNRYCRRGKTSS